MHSSRQFKYRSFFTSISQIPEEIWNQLGCTSNIYFHPDYLESLEKCNKHLRFFYVIIQDDSKNAIALATCQIIDFELTSLQINPKRVTNSIANFWKRLKIFPREKPLKILNCGNTFVSGEHGIFIRKNENKRKVLRSIAKAILYYSEKKLNFSIDLFLMKDFTEDSVPLSDELISLGYYAFHVEPNMRLDLHKDWSSFDDYLASLKTKFRVKAKKALKISEALEVKNIDTVDFDESFKPMTDLYQRVASKASFNLGEFDLSTYRDLKKKFGKQYVLRSYWHQNKMVGFLSGAFNENELDAHFVGIDYSRNRSLGIYQRMLYDYISIAIDQKLDVINFGRTASEIKSSVGAVPEHLAVYIRHKKTITNKFLKLFLFRIQPNEFRQKFPFKQMPQ